MNPLQQLFSIISMLLSVYSLLIFARIILSWFSHRPEHEIIRILLRITDPYLDFFRRYTPLRIGMLDFSVLVAIIVLNMLLFFSQEIARRGMLHPLVIVKYAVTSVLGVISFLFFILIIVFIVRIVMMFLGKSRTSRAAMYMDQFLTPIVTVIVKPFASRPITYRTGLIIGLISAIAANIGVSILNGLVIMYI